MAAAPVPFNDVRRIHAELRKELQAAYDRVLGHHEFILGSETKEFEKSFSAFIGTREAIGCTSGTDALVLALLGLGIGPEDEVVTTPLTFIATLESIVAVGARPVLADVGEDGQLDPAGFEAVITPKTRAVIPVHLYGHPADMAAITKIAASRKIDVIEDAAQAHGASVGGRNVGAWGRVSCFSFFPGKNLGALGDAGAVCTNDEKLAAEIRSLRDHGRTAKYAYRQFGRNMRMDGLQAAFLRAKLPHLARWNARRVEVARRYRKELQGLPSLHVMRPREDAISSEHLFVVLHPRREALAEALKKKGIETGVHYPTACHEQEAWTSLYPKKSFPLSEKIAAHCLSLPMFAHITDDEVSRVISAMKEVVPALG